MCGVLAVLAQVGWTSLVAATQKLTRARSLSLSLSSTCRRRRRGQRVCWKSGNCGLSEQKTRALLALLCGARALAGELLPLAAAGRPAGWARARAALAQTFRPELATRSSSTHAPRGRAERQRRLSGRARVSEPQSSRARRPCCRRSLSFSCLSVAAVLVAGAFGPRKLGACAKLQRLNCHA